VKSETIGKSPESANAFIKSGFSSNAIPFARLGTVHTGSTEVVAHQCEFCSGFDFL
jgi:hypothetical protein